MFNNTLKLCAVILLAAFGVGCATAPGYDYSAIYAAKPRSIVVIPPLNHSIEVDASYTFLSTISKPLAELGYYVFPVAVIDTFLKENGLPTPGEMNGIGLDKIAENIGADAVLYVEIDNWGQKYQVLSSKAVVSARLRLVDGKTGDLLWDAKAEAEEVSGNSGQGIIGALASALADQIVGSMVDKTYDLSRVANYTAIYDKRRGLPPGPYLPVELGN